MKRRDLLRAAALSSGFALLPVSLRDAFALDTPAGGLGAIEHVVIFMQENRSFDHYFGTLRGVRGFNDPAAITLPNGKPVFQQPDGTGYVLPYRVGDQFMSGTPHDWASGHAAWNKGRHDQWIPNKGKLTMTHLDRSGLPFYHALADAFTICDAYHCSVLGPTNPNRFHLFSGTVGYEPGSTTKRAIGNDAWQNLSHPGYTWTSYAERLEAAGRTWGVYQEWDNYGDNSLDYFASFLAVGRKALARTKDANGNPYTKLEFFYYAVQKASSATQTQLLDELAQGVATLTSAERSLYDRGLARLGPGQLASAFRADVEAGRLPAVSWIVAPEAQSEHPDWGPNTGADLVKEVLDALASNTAVWNKTLFLLTYDENDGFFDHVPPPVPPTSSSDGLSTAAVTDEIYNGEPIGLGNRVPMLVVSPWSRGGKVCSQVFDHTSVLRLLEQWSGVAEPNISPWRRAVCGDLTAVLDTTADTSYPGLPTPVPTSGAHGTSPKPPSPQSMPVQEAGTKRARPLPYDLTASGRLASDRFWLDFTNAGTAGAHFYVRANAYRTDGPWRYTVEAGKSLSDYWQSGTPTGAYDLTATGPHGFVRRFAGNRVTATTAGNANPEVTLGYVPADQLVLLRMTNTGGKACTLTVRAGNRGDGPWSYVLAAGASTEASFSTAGFGGWYDLTVTADTTDGFLRRFAGHLENGAESITDPVMAANPLPRTLKYADSQELTGENGAAANAVDGKTGTIWHTRWSNGTDPLPHEIQLDLGAVATVAGLTCLPRQDGTVNGRIGRYEVYLSGDGTNWGTPVATGAFADDATLKTVRFEPARARYVRLRALTEAGNRGPWTSAAEVTPLGWS
ncbi:phospholipase C, phosphocholine-specific [Kitasatospora atroaurantiaca]|uniref:Phospholipase C n=1 Tax=Kitasatospora atroaurantiaca TaxID=285545 RepID=A0A561F158_9ACTN|nr:phospholipase C, phosphocholine-specific [Kitasatospora atroaurantiaca]TWE21586.1 phospholipase C [Kitasatospora atroaurantiaca]